MKSIVLRLWNTPTVEWAGDAVVLKVRGERVRPKARAEQMEIEIRVCSWRSLGGFIVAARSAFATYKRNRLVDLADCEKKIGPEPAP